MHLTMNSAAMDVELCGIREFTALANETPGVVMLTIGEPDFNTPDVIKEAAKTALDNNDTHYPEGNGNLYLRQAIARYEERKNGRRYSPEEIIVTVGATEGLFATLFTLLNPGDEVLIPTPAFNFYEDITRLCRGVPVLLPTEKNRFQLTREQVESAITPRTKAIVLTSPNNPTGCIYTPETMDGIHEALKDRPIFVLCDEVYRQLIYTDSYTSFSRYADMRDRTVVVQSFSKPYAMTGWRAGYLLADAPVRERIQIVHQYGVVAVPSFIQPACAAALDYDNARELDILRRRKEYVYRRLRAMNLEVQEPEGAFYFFINIEPFGLDSLTFCTRMLRESKVALVPGRYFETEGYLRLSYCCGEDVLKTGLDRMESFLETLRREK